MTQYGPLAAVLAVAAGLEGLLWWVRRRHHARLARWARHEGWTYAAREDGYPWGPNGSWMPAAGGAIGPAGSLVIQSSPWDS